MDPDTDAMVSDSDRARLSELGYKQELKRHLSAVANFAFSFSIISVMAGITTTYNTGLRYGGAVSMTVGWVVVSVFNAFIALSMAEICSAYPTSGGLYYWSAKLAGKEWAPLAAWITGWFNIAGQWAGTTSVDFSLAQLLQVIILLSTGGANGGGYLASKYVVLCFHAGFLLLHGIINSLPITWLSIFGQFGAIWNAIGVFVLMLLIPSVAMRGLASSFCLLTSTLKMGLGFIARQRKQKNAGKNGPFGIISAVSLSAVIGWAYLIGITLAVTNIPNLLNPENNAGGYAVTEVFYLAFKNRYGSGVGGIACLGIVAVALFFCGISCVTSNSRMAYAFSRDGAMPLSSVWQSVNKQEIPINTVWLSVVIAFCMALTSLGSLVTFQAMASIATIGLYIAYALPIFFRVTLGRKSFIRGPFSLGRYGVLIGWLAVLWVATISVLFSLPVAYPITKDTLNYTPIAVGGVIVLTLSSWILSARHWFKGPKTNIGV